MTGLAPLEGLRRAGLGTAGALSMLLILCASPATAVDLQETPMLADAVAAGELPPVAERVPETLVVVDMEATGRQQGLSGGEISWIAGRARDIRIMNVYGYARLVGYAPDLTFQADILESYEVEEGRIFTFHLRPGHRWSDGAPFTTEDFRYQWFDIDQNEELKPFGPDARLLVDGEQPTVEILDELTVRYTWSAPNPEFLPALAGARPLYIYAPAHYLQQFHADYVDPDALAALVEENAARNWAALHINKSNLYSANNPNLPVLQPWHNTTAPPSERFVFERNPFYHRVDSTGLQLPYLDRVIVTISDSGLIAAKVGSGEADLQSRHLRFDTYTFLKEGEERHNYTVHLWPTALGSELAIYPNLNASDPVLRELNRDVRFRRALSLAIDREEINQVIYYGLATVAQNTALPQSPLYDEARSLEFTEYDLEAANALLDEMGLTERDSRGTRLRPDGEPLEIVVETAGERTEETDILQLIADSWRQAGVVLHTTTSQRDVFRTRVFSGETAMSTWWGFDNALFTPDTVPTELAPVAQTWLQYPKWGQYLQTGGEAGEPVDMPLGEGLMALYEEWLGTTDRDRRAEILSEMLDIHVDQLTSIGIVNGVLQPVVVRNTLRNVPELGIYSWDPGGHFGVYRPDTFWIDE